MKRNRVLFCLGIAFFIIVIFVACAPASGPTAVISPNETESPSKYCFYEYNNEKIVDTYKTSSLSFMNFSVITVIKQNHTMLYYFGENGNRMGVAINIEKDNSFPCSSWMHLLEPDIPESSK